MTSGPQDARPRHIEEAVRRSGVYVELVPQPMPLETSWYTVGLTGHGHPELILFGLPPDLARPALHTVASEIIAGHRTCSAGEVADDVLPGHRVRFVAVTEPERHLPAAAQFYAGTGSVVTALQIVWPDRYHRWPWDPGTRVSEMPVLGRSA